MVRNDKATNAKGIHLLRNIQWNHCHPTYELVLELQNESTPRKPNVTIKFKGLNERKDFCCLQM